MRNLYFIFIVIILTLFITGCSNLSKVDLSNFSEEDVNKVIACNPPYMRFATGCCLDANNNKVCDNDETKNQSNFNIKKILENSEIQSSSKDFSTCRSIIPERIKLECRDYLISADGTTHFACNYINYTNPKSDKFNNEPGTPIPYYWADGTPFSAYNLKFRKPDRIGENANYLYLKGGVLGYKKENISPDGTIQRPTDWIINIAIDPKDMTDDGYKIVQYKCQGSGLYFDNTFKMI